MIQESFLTSLIELCSRGEEIRASELVSEVVSSMISTDLFDEVDNLLAAVDVESFKDYLIVLSAFLTSTVCFSYTLLRRESFKRSVENLVTISRGQEFASHFVLDNLDHFQAPDKIDWIS